jgi:hypothetical protein
MELDVTPMVWDADYMIELSGNRVEHGQDAARITWNNSKVYAHYNPILTTDEQREAARAHFKQYGAWSEEEIAAWSEGELQGRMVQDVAAAIREMEAYDTLKEYAEACGGRLYHGDDSRWYYYLGF